MVSKSLIVGMMFLLSLSFVIAYTPDIFGHEMAEIDWIASVCGVGEMMVGFLNTGMPNCQSSSISSLSASDGSPVDAVYVDADGDVGIGTTSPSEKLDVFGAVRASRSGEQYIEIVDNSAGGFITGKSRENNKKSLYIQNLHSDGGSPAGEMTMIFRVGSFASPVEALRIKENGNVGIGTVNPSAKLEVAGRIIATEIRAIEADYVVGAMTTIAYKFVEGRGWGYNVLNDRVFYNAANGEIPFFVDRNAASFDVNVGIGTTSPGAKLEVIGSINIGDFSNNAVGNLQIKGDGANQGVTIWDESGASTFRMWTDVTANTGHLTKGAAATAGITIASGGNVGIGTVNPGAKLHVAGDLIVDGTISGSFTWSDLCTSKEQTGAGTLTCAANEYLVDTFVNDAGSSPDYSVNYGYGGSLVSVDGGGNSFGILCCEDP